MQKGFAASLSLSTSQSEISKDGGTLDIDVTSNAEYTISIPDPYKSWISVSSTSQTNNTIKFAILPNPEPENRTGQIDFCINDIVKSCKITQKGEPFLEIVFDPSAPWINLDPEGGKGKIIYEANFKCKVTTEKDWVTILNHSFSNNIGTIDFLYNKNDTDNNRSNTFTLYGYNLIKYYQTDQECILNVVPITTSKAGALSSVLESSYRYEIPAYKISGPLNSSDIVYIRDMFSHTGSKVHYLDLSDATIVAGGEAKWYRYYFDGLTPIEDKSTFYQTKNNTITSYMFSHLLYLKTLILPKSVTTIENNAFAESYLHNLTLPDNIINIYCGFGCSGHMLNGFKLNLNPKNQHYTIKDGILYSKDMKKLITYPIRWLVGIERFEVPDSVEEIYPYAFYGWINIHDLVVGPNVKKIGDRAFDGCSIKDFTLYNSTEYGSFGSAIIQNLHIPKEFKEFNPRLFFNENSKIEHIWVYNPTPPSTNRTLFYKGFYSNTVLHVPKGSLTSYRLAYSWGEFKKIEEFIP